MPYYKNARAYLEAVYERYRSLEAYSDTGLSRSLGRRHPSICWFDTKYLRPNQFRFAFERPHPYPRLRHLTSKCVVGHDGQSPYFFSMYYSGIPVIDHPESLSMVVAGATGISNGTAHTIGALLFADIDCFTLLDLERIRFRRNRTVLGVPCICVSGMYPRAGNVAGMHPRVGGRWTAWFGAEDIGWRQLSWPVGVNYLGR